MTGNLWFVKHIGHSIEMLEKTRHIFPPKPVTGNLWFVKHIGHSIEMLEKIRHKFPQNGIFVVLKSNCVHVLNTH